MAAGTPGGLHRPGKTRVRHAPYRAYGALPRPQHARDNSALTEIFFAGFRQARFAHCQQQEASAGPSDVFLFKKGPGAVKPGPLLAFRCVLFYTPVLGFAFCSASAAGACGWGARAWGWAQAFLQALQWRPEWPSPWRPPRFATEGFCPCSPQPAPPSRQKIPCNPCVQGLCLRLGGIYRRVIRRGNDNRAVVRKFGHNGIICASTLGENGKNSPIFNISALLFS